MEHTPLPWWNESCVIHASNGKGGATHPANCTPVDFLDGDWERATADAEFICRAANNYAKLLEALEKLTPIAFDALEVWRDEFSNELVDYFAAVEQAREAVEEARK